MAAGCLLYLGIEYSLNLSVPDDKINFICMCDYQSCSCFVAVCLFAYQKIPLNLRKDIRNLKCIHWHSALEEDWYLVNHEHDRISLISRR